MLRAPDRSSALALLLLPILGFALVVAIRGPVAHAMTTFQVAAAAAGLAWLVALRLALNGAARGAGGLGLVLAGAVALRLLVLVGSPELSDDVHRTIWEGRIVADGGSPYAHAPSADEHAALRARDPELYRRINHPDVSAAYPPLAQAAGAAIVSAAEVVSPRGLDAVAWVRAAYALCDLAVLWPLCVLLRRRGLPTGLCVAWGWSPLVVLAFAGSGHIDSLGILLLLGALCLLERPGRLRGAFGFAFLAGAALVKLLPLAALPFAVRARGGGRGRWLVRALAVLALCVAATLPFAFGERGLAGLASGVGQYGLRWESTSLVYRFVEPPLAALAGALQMDEARDVARIVGRAAIGSLWLAWLAWRWRRGDGALAGTAAAVGAFLVLSPTLHPWYVCWIVPFAAVRVREPTSAAWLWLACAAPLLYCVIAGWQLAGRWEEPAWLWPVVALPFFALLVRGALRSASAGLPPGSSPVSRPVSPPVSRPVSETRP